MVEEGPRAEGERLGRWKVGAAETTFLWLNCFPVLCGGWCYKTCPLLDALTAEGSLLRDAQASAHQDLVATINEEGKTNKLGTFSKRGRYMMYLPTFPGDSSPNFIPQTLEVNFHL